jgi:hypothetical protein
VTFRREQQSLRDGRYQDVAVAVNESHGQLSIRRGAVLVVCNLGKGTATFAVDTRHRLLLTSDPGVCCDESAIHLPAESVALLQDPEGVTS